MNTPLVEPIQVYVTWLDEQTAILALTDPSISRVVIGIANPSQTAAGLGHLEQIPGFNEIVPTSEIRKFRAAVAKTDPDQTKYRITEQQIRRPISLAEIDKEFLRYVHSRSGNPGALDVWNVSYSEGQTEVVFLRDRVLVNPESLSSPHNYVEQEIVKLLVAIASASGSGRHNVSLEDGCADAASNLKLARQSSFNANSRAKLQDSLTGKISGADGKDANEYIVSNSSWVNDRKVRLNVNPPPTAESNFTMTAVIGGKQVNVLEQRGFDLTPCQTARVSVEPRQRWYQFPEPVRFKLEQDTLSVNIRDPYLGSFWLLALIVAIAGGALTILWLLRTVLRRRRGRNRTWGVTIAAPINRPTEQKTYMREGPNSNPAPESLQQRLQEFNSRHAELMNEIQEVLPRLGRMDQTQIELKRLEDMLKEEQTKHERWQALLRELGDSPEAIVQRWRRLEQQQQFMKDQVFKIEALLSGRNGRGDGTDADVHEALNALHQGLPKLKEYESATLRIADLVGRQTAIHGDVDGVVESVERFCSLAHYVLRKYAEPLQIDSKSLQFSEQSVADIESRFARLVKAHEMLANIETDERIHMARLSSLRIRKAGKLLYKLQEKNPEYASLFLGTGLELTLTARQLQEASESLNAALARASSRDLPNENGGALGEPEIDQILIIFVTKLLSDNYEPLVKMLRLCQVLEIYCRDSSDPLVANIHVDSHEFRTNCHQILADFEHLGIHFHEIRFLEDPREHGLDFDQAPSVARIQTNPRLFRAIQKRLELTDGYWKMVADVAKWGVECDLDPNRNSRTMLWLWSAVSTGLSE